HHGVTLGPDELVDHICMNKGCVNPDHLRLASKKQNNEHLSPARKNNRLGLRGVSWHEASGKWAATVGHNGKHYHLGLFTDPADAAEVARVKRLELFTQNAIDRVA